MAGSQFISAAKVSPSRVVRRFTVEQANRALPYVKRIVADLVKVNEQVETLQTKLENQGESKTAPSLQRDLGERVTRLNELVQELGSVGVELKDHRAGQVDFVGRHKGRDVYLCWTLGDERVTHWHEVNAGFAARQPVATLVEGE